MRRTSKSGGQVFSERVRLVLIGCLTCFAFSGCNSQPPAAPSATAAPKVAAAAPAESGAAPSASPQPAETHAAKEESSAAEKAAAPSLAKPQPKPTAEQIAQWEKAGAPPLKLLACADGFEDVFVQSLAVTPDGKQFVLGGAKLSLWNTGAPKPTLDLLEKYKPEEVERPILSVGIAPNGEWVAAGDSKGRLRIWKLSDQSELFNIQAHEGRLTALAISPDSKQVATTSYSGEVRVWGSAEGKKTTDFKVDDQEIVEMAFYTDTALVCAGRETTLWSIETGKKSMTLSQGNVINPALGVSMGSIAFADSDSTVKIRSFKKDGGTTIHHAAPSGRIEFSPDGKWIAALTGRSTISIWNAKWELVQVLDAEGGRTVALKWLPGNNALAVASEHGRVRIWGTAEAATALGIQPLAEPEMRATAADAKRSYSSALFQKVIEVRSFPRLPDAVPSFGDDNSVSYTAPGTKADAELFYRFLLGDRGWEEAPANPVQPGLTFQKQGCELSVTIDPATPPTGREGDLLVSLNFHGNYDVRWLPKISPIESKSTWSSFSNAGYRTKASLTEVEGAVLKQFHAAGWTAYTRLAASGTEDPRSRTISMLQGGSVLTVYFGHPADAADEVFVQTSVHVSNKSLPIPADSGWIEFDNSTDLQLVANTKMDLKQSIEFYDKEMALDGWISREAGRTTKPDEPQAWLPYIRGQQDVLIHLVSLPEGEGGGGTRVIVGEAASSSWQLAKPPAAKPATEQAGIEAADLELPKGATAVKFDVDQKQIEYELAGTTPLKLANQFIQQMEAMGWKRDGSGILGDDYSFVTYEKGEAEIEFRGRESGKKSTVMISGDGLLWTKPLPTAAVRISYETWLRRHRKPASLEHLDEFLAEMRAIPVAK